MAGASAPVARLLGSRSKPPAAPDPLPEYRRTWAPASRLAKQPEGLGLDAGGSLVGFEPGRSKGGVMTIGASSTDSKASLSSRSPESD